MPKTKNYIIWQFFFSISKINFSDVPALVDTVLECTEKIVLHAQNFARILHKAGEAKKMMYLLSGMKLVKNKVMTSFVK